MDYLSQLDIAYTNSGACWGASYWSVDTIHAIESINPTNNQVYSAVYSTQVSDWKANTCRQISTTF